MTEQANIEAAAQRLARGELVAFPTETVYGLGADASQDAAVARIFAAKGRPANHPLIVHVASLEQVAYFAAQIPDFAQKLLAAFAPGPLTVILPRKADVAAVSAGGQGSIGIRIPAHPLAQALLQAALHLGVQGVSAPSANKFGRVSPTTAAHVYAEFAEDIMVLDGGACEVGIESTIVDCSRGAPVLLRPGVITRAALEAAMGMPLQASTALKTAAPRASGTLESHYAPVAKVRIKALLPVQPPQGVALWQLPSDPALAAQLLFAKLRELDEQAPREIWVSTPAQTQEWAGVADRLQRAAA